MLIVFVFRREMKRGSWRQKYYKSSMTLLDVTEKDFYSTIGFEGSSISRFVHHKSDIEKTICALFAATVKTGTSKKETGIKVSFF